MAVNEQIVTGRKFRKLVDEATKLWQRISFWTKASDVEFDDGSTAETKMGAINGITDSLASTSSNIAASAKALSQLNNNLMFPDGLKFYPDLQDGKRGFNTDPARGADTFFPFSSVEIIHIQSIKGTQKNVTLTFENPYKKKILACFGYCPGNSAQHFMYDFLHDSGAVVNSISKTEASITIVRNVTSTSAATYTAWVVLA